jgi:hypothetical protein
MPNQQPHHAGEIYGQVCSIVVIEIIDQRWASMPLKSRMDAATHPNTRQCRVVRIAKETDGIIQ